MQREQNILRVYHQAGAGEIDAGLRWYLQGHEFAAELGREICRPLPLASPGDGTQTELAAAVIAAVSPGLRWERNITAAQRIVRGEGLEGLGVRWYDGVRKAKRMLAGERPEVVLRGNKVRAFWQNLAYPTTSDSVCIDGHAYAIWAGERIMLDAIPTISNELYKDVSDAYVNASQVVGIRPSQLQAITWCTWRRLHDVASNHYLPLFE